MIFATWWCACSLETDGLMLAEFNQSVVCVTGVWGKERNQARAREAWHTLRAWDYTDSPLFFNSTMVYYK